MKTLDDAIIVLAITNIEGFGYMVTNSIATARMLKKAIRLNYLLYNEVPFLISMTYVVQETALLEWVKIGISYF